MEKKLITVKIEEIIPYKNNPRKNDKAVMAVSESIRQTGYNNPIIIDENMVILAGHTRLKSLKKLGKTEENVLQIIGLSEEQKKKYRLLDNKAGEYASWDYVALVEELADINWEGLEIDWGLDKIGEREEETDNEPTQEEEDFEYECPECGFRFNAK